MQLRKVAGVEDMPQKGLGVVIVDDAQALRSVLRAVLVGDGYRVLADLPSGQRVLETVDQFKPQMVCLDFDLPDVDGLSLLRELRAAHPEVSVVMITGCATDAVASQAADAGAAGFIRKPFSPEQVLSELRQVAHAQRMLRQTQKSANPLVQDRLIPAVIADDSETMRQLLSAILHQAGVAVLGEASNGEEALRLVGEIRPELVFLDYAMPVMNGLDAMRVIHKEYPQIRMMITAHADRELVRQSGLVGACGYILKPYRPEKVLEAVARLLAH